MFFFVIHELKASHKLNRFLLDLIRAGGLWRIRLVAYALRTKPAEFIESEVQEFYSKAKIDADLRETPAALAR